MKKRSFSPSQLRIILALCLLLIGGGGVALFVVGYQRLVPIATELSHKRLDAEASSNNLEALRKLETALKGERSVADTIKQLRLARELPEFEAINAVNTLASKYKLPVDSINFSADAGSGTAPQAASTSRDAGGTKSVNITLATRGEMPLPDLMGFLYAAEHSLPYMKISGVRINRGQGNTVSVEPITIEVIIA